MTGFIAFLCLWSSCTGTPEEGEIVIRAEDMIPGETVSDEPIPPESLLTVSVQTDSVTGDSPNLTTDLCDSTGAPIDTLQVDAALVESTGGMELPSPLERIAIEINGSIYRSLQDCIDSADITGAHIVRCMWWNTDPWDGMSRGDSLYVLLGNTGRENQVVALSYVPVDGSSNSRFSVYSYLMNGDNYPSHFYDDGREVMRMLDYMPISTFEEMTGPYGEPRGDHDHAGVDFKAPEGTAVRTCRGGTVTRVNWNLDYNGNCVSISMGGGYREIFLHLHSIAGGIVPGVVLQRGDTVGYVGNTGITSTSSHLHYQINDENGNPIDPYIFYSSHRRTLPPDDMEDFKLFLELCNRRMYGDSL